MITLAIILACVAAYFFIGWMLMQWDMHALWIRARKAHVDGHYSPELFEPFARSQVHSGASLTFLFWPVRLPFLVVMHSAELQDPERIAAEIEAQQRRITELERELRIGRKP